MKISSRENVVSYNTQVLAPTPVRHQGPNLHLDVLEVIAKHAAIDDLAQIRLVNADLYRYASRSEGWKTLLESRVSRICSQIIRLPINCRSESIEQFDHRTRPLWDALEDGAQYLSSNLQRGPKEVGVTLALSARSYGQDWLTFYNEDLELTEEEIYPDLRKHFDLQKALIERFNTILPKVTALNLETFGQLCSPFFWKSDIFSAIEVVRFKDDDTGLITQVDVGTVSAMSQARITTLKEFSASIGLYSAADLNTVAHFLAQQNSLEILRLHLVNQMPSWSQGSDPFENLVILADSLNPGLRRLELKIDARNDVNFSLNPDKFQLLRDGSFDFVCSILN